MTTPTVETKIPTPTVETKIPTPTVEGEGEGEGEADKDDVIAKLVKMSREPEQHPAPYTADVHPDEVENYLHGGWIIDAVNKAK